MPHKITQLFQSITTGNTAAIARGITIVENELAGADELLLNSAAKKAPNIIGITGAPGAGKSTLTEALVQHWTTAGKKIAVVAVDPSSPFNFGALLGDRIRMSRFYHHDQVFIRSLSSRGALGGLHPRIWEIIELIKKAPFDFIIIETVGVGQSEVDVAGLADCTVVTLVPEGGDEIQTLKAGIMEIADVFAINKSDRPGADDFYIKVKTMAHERNTTGEETPVVKTTATLSEGIDLLAGYIEQVLASLNRSSDRRVWMLTEKIWQLIQRRRMKGLNKETLLHEVAQYHEHPDFNWFAFAKKYF